MKPCENPLCEREVVRAKWCRWCYDKARGQTPERKRKLAAYQRRAEVKEVHREACRVYRASGKGRRGVCRYCGEATSGEEVERCGRCYRREVLPVARQRALESLRRKREAER